MEKAEDLNCIYRNSNEPIEARVKDLLSRMTLKEKVGQMTQIERRVATPSAMKDFSIGTLSLSLSLSIFLTSLIMEDGVLYLSIVLGSILSAGGSGPFENALSADWADMVDGFQRSALETRLRIPMVYGIDAVHGNNNVYGATIFPHNVGLGATRLVFFTQFAHNM